MSETGDTARLVSKYFPSQPVIVLTQNAKIARQIHSVFSNCRCKLVPDGEDIDTSVRRVLDEAVGKGSCKTGDSVICLYGMKGLVAGTTNAMKVYQV